MAHERLVDLLERLGAAPADDVRRWLLELTRDLARAAARLEVSVELVSVGPPGTPTLLEARPFSGSEAELVQKLAALGYQLLKGSPPPVATPVSPEALTGVRPELVRVLLAGLDGSISRLSELALRLEATPAGTAAFNLHDTVTSGSGVRAVSPGRVGSVLGSYELLELLGAGGMGEVYRARHARLGREVAIKVLRPELASNAEIVHRFFQEAKVVNDINHPHIVQVIDFAEAPGVVFCVMELLKGRSLTAVVREEGPLSLERIARLVTQACEALIAAHARGVVHRDIKPDNLFVSLDGNGVEHLKVLDFGIARRLAPGEGRGTQLGLVMGTPSYMAPEQAAGRPVDARADVYALGVVLYELLSGSEMATLKGSPVRLEMSARGEQVPTALADVVEASLKLDPESRPGSVEAVMAALQQRKRPTSRRWLFAAASGVALTVALTVWWSSDVEPSTDAGTTALAPRDAGANAVAAPLKEASAPNVSDAGQALPSPLDAGAPDALEQPVTPPDIKPRGEEVLRPKVQKLRGRYERLVQRFGESQLTAIERATCEAVFLAGPEVSRAELKSLLDSANQALDDAELRLGR